MGEQRSFNGRFQERASVFMCRLTSRGSECGRLKAFLQQRGVLGHKQQPESEVDMKSSVGRELKVMLSLFLPLTVQETYLIEAAAVR